MEGSGRPGSKPDFPTSSVTLYKCTVSGFILGEFWEVGIGETPSGAQVLTPNSAHRE